MRHKSAFVAFLLAPSIALAATCSVPEFETFAAVANSASEPESVLVEMQPVATLRVPSGFAKIGILPNGSLGLGQHPKNISAVLGFETKESVAVHKKGAKPAPFMLSIFKGLNTVGCRYLQGYQLEAQDYRLHGNLGGNAELFAYGKGDRHQFYLIRTDKPDFVLSGLFRNIDRAGFEAILSTLIIK